MNGKNRSDVKPGISVKVVKKEDQKTGKLTQGIVIELLTNSATHPHGIKVKLVDGTVGRVQEIMG
ncbi:MAG: YwbE family protein [Fusobacteriaceae bacterium]